MFQTVQTLSWMGASSEGGSATPDASEAGATLAVPSAATSTFTRVGGPSLHSVASIFMDDEREGKMGVKEHQLGGMPVASVEEGGGVLAPARGEEEELLHSRPRPLPGLPRMGHRQLPNRGTIVKQCRGHGRRRTNRLVVRARSSFSLELYEGLGEGELDGSPEEADVEHPAPLRCLRRLRLQRRFHLRPHSLY